MWAGVSRPVGENGVEWFTPERNGTISDQPAGGGGGGNQIIFNITSNDPKAVATVVRDEIRQMQRNGQI